MNMLPLEIFYIYFSPYTAHAIELDGVVYSTVEHAYQCARYTDPKIIEEIRMAGSPVKAWGSQVNTNIFKYQNSKAKITN